MTQLAAIYPELLGKTYAGLVDRECRKDEETRTPRAGNQHVTHENTRNQSKGAV